MVAAAVEPLARVLAREPIGRPQRTMISTVTGARLSPDVDVRGLLLRQVTSPVRFLEAMSSAAEGIDLWIEAGPGRVLSGLVDGWLPAPVVAIEVGGESLGGLLGAVGAAFALGAPLEPAALHRPARQPSLPDPVAASVLRQPLRAARPLPEETPRPRRNTDPAGDRADGSRPAAGRLAGRSRAISVLELFRDQVAAKVELPPWSVEDGNRLLSDLHLNSIAVGQLVVRDGPTPRCPASDRAPGVRRRHGRGGRGGPRGAGPRGW